MFEAETKSFVEGEHAEDAELGTFDEYGFYLLGPIRVIFNGATIVQGVDGESVLMDTPNVTVFLPSLETVAGGELGASHAIKVRGKTYPVRVQPQKNAHSLANIRLHKALA